MATIARTTSGLNDIQTLSVFHQLKRDGARHYGAQTPISEQQWEEFIDNQKADVEASTIYTNANRRSVLERLDAARSEVPDGQNFYALNSLTQTCQRNNAALRTTLANLADGLEITEEEAKARYEQYENEVDRSRDAAPPEGYDRASRIALRREDLPSDRGTFYAVTRMRQDVRNLRVERAINGPQRIERQPVADSGSIVEMGYDPDGGRLEVVLADNPDHVYAYNRVPTSAYEAIQVNGEDAFNSHVRNSSRYRYETQEEADLDRAARQCPDCGQFASSSHACPPREARLAELARVRAEEQARRAAREAEELALAQAEAERRNQNLRINADLIEQGQPLPERPSVNNLSDNQGRRARANTLLATDDTSVADDYVIMPNVATIREAAGVTPVQFNVNYSGYRNSRAAIADPNSIPSGSFDVSGRVTIDNPATGHWACDTSELQCQCPDYAANYDCPHVRLATRAFQAGIIPAGVTADPDGPAAVALSEAVVREALRSDWTRSEAYSAEARARWASQDTEENYSTNMAAFQEDVDAALARQAAGEAPVPYMTENATGGLCAPGGRSFGLEIEFDFPNGVDQYAALEAIGEDLHAEGLTQYSGQAEYHSALHDGYSNSHDGGWSFEEDCTVAGEIVSPIMNDTPETWEKVAKVCEIVKRHGGVASARTGSHVHVSADTYNHTVENHTELIRMANQHEDVLYRVSQNPENGRHRPMQWCGPNRDVAPAGYNNLYQATGSHGGHGYGINLESVNGDSSDHVEVRHWDGTLDPAVIQTQIKISAAMVEAAQRTAQIGPSTREREPVGAHHRRLRALRGTSRRRLTSEEFAEDTATARSFMDTLFTRREDKAQVAALFAITKWHRQ